jgi:hypothetical protein
VAARAWAEALLPAQAWVSASASAVVLMPMTIKIATSSELERYPLGRDDQDRHH